MNSILCSFTVSSINASQRLYSLTNSLSYRSLIIIITMILYRKQLLWSFITIIITTIFERIASVLFYNLFLQESKNWIINSCTNLPRFNIFCAIIKIITQDSTWKKLKYWGKTVQLFSLLTKNWRKREFDLQVHFHFRPRVKNWSIIFRNEIMGNQLENCFPC